MRDLWSDRRGSAVQWFAVAAAMLCVASLAGAHALDWLAQSGRVAMVAYRAPPGAPDRRLASDPNVDPMPTGAIPTSNALVIRIR